MKKLILSNGLDASGKNLAELALDYLAVALLGLSATQIGLLTALEAVFFTFFSVPIGVYLDRRPSARLALSAGVLKGATLSVILVALVLDALTIYYLFAAAIIFGSANIASENSQVKLVGLVGEPGKTTWLASKLESADTLASLIVPAAGGLLLAWAGVTPVLALGAALAFASALVLLKFATAPHQTGEPDSAPSEHEATHADSALPDQMGALRAFLREAAEGWTHLWGSPTLVKITLTSIAINFGLAMFSAIETLLVLREFNLGAQILGFSLAAGAAGGLLAATAHEKLTQAFSEIAIFKTSVALTPLSPALFAAALLWPQATTALVLAGSLLWGFTMVLYNILNMGISIAVTPEHVLGRVMSFRRVIGMGLVPLGALTGGLLADTVSYMAVLLLWGCLALTALVVISTLPWRPLDW